MAATGAPASETRGARQQYLAVGLVASAGALLVTPVVDAVSPLHFLGGLIVAVLGPGLLGLVALGVGAQLYRLEATRRGVGVVVLGLLTTLAGVGYGLGAVF